jgi:outer membrane receptor protein involved in Fe transport
VAYTRSLGIVFTPTFLDGFTATVDYYSIKISGAVASLPFQTIMTNCYDPKVNVTQDPNNPYCLLIHRDNFGSFNTSAGYASLENFNINSDVASGFDVEANYNSDLDKFGLPGAGSIGLNMVGTLVEKADFVAGGVDDKCAGHFDASFCDVPNPRWRHRLRLSWTSADSDWSAFAQWRYFTSTTDKDLITADPIDAYAPGASYFDIGGSYNLTKQFSFYAGANNVLDKKPPLFDDQIFSPATENANTFPGVYDSMGITFFGGVTVKL